MLTEEQKATFRRMMELREKRDADKLAAENSEVEYREFEAELWDRMTEEGVLDRKDATLRVPLGGEYGTVTFSPSETYYGRVLDKEKALEFFEQSAQIDEYTQSKIVMARVNELVRQCREDGIAPPPGIDFYANRYITITRQK